MISSTHDFVGRRHYPANFARRRKFLTGSQRKYRVSPVRLRKSLMQGLFKHF